MTLGISKVAQGNAHGNSFFFINRQVRMRFGKTSSSTLFYGYASRFVGREAPDCEIGPHDSQARSCRRYGRVCRDLFIPVL